MSVNFGWHKDCDNPNGPCGCGAWHEWKPDVDNTLNFLLCVLKEHSRAVKLFPEPHGLLAALVEEVGELSKAILDEPWINVQKEAIQVAAMAMRIALEGDPTLDDVRRKRLMTGQNKPDYSKESNGREP